jgi:hypothetical protein
MWNRVLSVLVGPIVASWKETARAAAAARLAGRRRWADTKASYLASLTTYFHPMRRVDVAVRPLEIRFLHYTKRDDLHHLVDDAAVTIRL